MLLLLQIYFNVDVISQRKNFLNLAKTKFGTNQSFKLNFSQFLIKFSNYREKIEFSDAGIITFYTDL